MKLTPAQKRDIDLCLYFYPSKPKETEIEEYLALSEHGYGDNRGKFSSNPLILGKTKRGLAMRMWEEGVLEGTIPYFTLLGGYQGIRKWYNPLRLFLGTFYHIPVPRYVVDFMKKEMFRGIDSEVIERCYGEILST